MNAQSSLTSPVECYNQRIRQQNDPTTSRQETTTNTYQQHDKRYLIKYHRKYDKLFSQSLKISQQYQHILQLYK